MLGTKPDQVALALACHRPEANHAHQVRRHMRERMVDRPARPWHMAFVGGLELVDLREWI
jgi:hypothetical protein